MIGLKRSVLGFFLVAGIFLCGAGFAHAGGIPAGIVSTSGGALDVVLLNFSDQDFTRSEVTQLVNAVVPFTAFLGSTGTDMQILTPDMLMGAGFDADSLHALILDNLNMVELYSRVDVTKVQGPVGQNLRFDLFVWYTDFNGEYVGSVEIPQSLVDTLTQGNFMMP